MWRSERQIFGGASPPFSLSASSRHEFAANFQIGTRDPDPLRSRGTPKQRWAIRAEGDRVRVTWSRLCRSHHGLSKAPCDETWLPMDDIRCMGSEPRTE